MANNPILFSPTHHTHLIPSLALLHHTCITSPPYTIATFLPPLSLPRMEAWWAERVEEVRVGKRFLFVVLGEGERSEQSELSQLTKRDGEEGEGEGGNGKGKTDVVLGCVMLVRLGTETGPQRAGVEKLLVAPEARGMGVARRLMAVLEEKAREVGGWLLLLDTEEGSPAEFIYPKLGYTEVGRIPSYGISHVDGSWKGGVFFYKNLLESETC